MLTAIKEIGQFVANSSNVISETKIEGKVFFITIDLGNLSFDIDIEDFNSEKTKIWLYKTGSSKGNKPSPFPQLTEPKKTYKKIKRWLKQCEDTKNSNETDKQFLQTINKFLKEQEDLIIKKLEEKIKELSLKKSEKTFLSIKFQDEKRYLGEYEIFRKSCEEMEDLKFKESSSLGKSCSVCGFIKDEVSGTLDTFKFYTTDKPGFITGGFKESIAWKNFPVCAECKDLLEKGKGFMENNLKFKFYDLNYYLIPKLFVGNKDLLDEILKILSDTNKKISLKNESKKRLTDDEDEILDYVSEVNDNLSLNFLFLKKEQSAERILLLIEDILPSRIRRILSAKDYVDKILGEDFTFKKIRTFYSKSEEDKRENDLNKYFLEIVDKVFKGQQIDFSFLLKFYMNVIRKEFIKDDKGYFKFRVKDALMCNLFLKT